LFRPTAGDIVPERSEWDTCWWVGVDNADYSAKWLGQKMPVKRADRASEIPASIAQSKRVGAWHPASQVHIIPMILRDAVLACLLPKGDFAFEPIP